MARYPDAVPRHLGHTGIGEAQTRFAASGMPDELPVERMPLPIRDFLRYWADRRGGAAMPDYADIDPVDIPRILPHVMLWTTRVDGGRLDFMCRLAGGEIAGAARARIVGRSLDDLNGRNAEQSRAEFELVARTGVPHYVERTADWIERPHVHYCRLLAPLSRAGTEFGDLVSVLTYDTP